MWASLYPYFWVIRTPKANFLPSLVVRIQDFGGEDPSYLSREDFDKLRSGEEEDSLEVGLKSWCIVKLE